MTRLSFWSVPYASLGEVLASLGIPSRTLECSDPPSEKITRKKRKRKVVSEVSVPGALALSGMFQL